MQDKFDSYTNIAAPRIAGLFAAKLREEVKKIKSLEDIAKIDLHVPEFEEALIIANLLGRLDETEIQLLEAEFEEAKEINPFEIKFEEAIKYFNNKRPELIENLDEITDEAKANYFWLKKSTNLTVTSMLFKNLGNNLEHGGTFKGWLKDIDSVIAKEGLTESGWYWENVYRNAKMGAYSAGHWEQQQESKADFPYLQYDGIRDGREQDHTKEFDGKIFPVDHDFWLTYYPPNWYFCRCGTIALTREEMQEEGLKVSRYTKSMKAVKLGSWEGNPGVNYLDSLKSTVEDKQSKVDKLVEKTKTDISTHVTDKLKKDLNLKRVNLKKLDLDQLHVVDKEVRSFMKKYPNTKLDILRVGIEEDYVGAFCELKQNKGVWEISLSINERFVNKFKSLSDMNKSIKESFESGWWAPQEFNDIIEHELGHAATYSNILKNVKFYTENKDKMKYNRIGIEVSLYGAKNGYEAIAEAFVAKKNGQKLSKALIKFVKEWTGVDLSDNAGT